MNPLDELQRLVAPFPGSADTLFLSAEHVPASVVPQPYRRLLVHDQHMTISMESYHQCRVDVDVLDRTVTGMIYCRKIRLRKAGTKIPVQYGLVRFDLSYVVPAVREKILAEEIPLGRVLIEHNVLRHIDLGAILKIQAGPELANALAMPVGGVTYGRLATIFCNQKPAVDLLEVSSQLVEEPAEG